jgi:hypothetical protein
MKINYRFKLFLAAIMASFIVGNAAAHIKNEASQFPDIEFSDARFDIVLLVGAGIIPETPVFEPDTLLSRNDLASWAALAESLGVGGETPDTEKLAAAALERGLIESLDGQATYADINKAFFRGQLTPDEPAAVPSKGEAASFIAMHLNTPAGEALLARRGVRMGPAGYTAQVELQQNPDGHNTYMITIGDTSLPMYAHGRVANGPTDLIQWDGRTVRRSFIREQGDLAFWTYLEAEPITMPEDDGALVISGDQTMPQASTDRRLLYGLVAAASGLGLILFFQGRRSS